MAVIVPVESIRLPFQYFGALKRWLRFRFLHSVTLSKRKIISRNLFTQPWFC